MENQKEELRKKTRSLEEILESTPHTEVNLPSEGIIYPKDNILSKGKLHIRYLKGKDEEILLSPKNLKDTGFADLLLKRVVLEPDFNVLDLSIGDKMYLLLASRISSLGDEYRYKHFECNFCGHEEEDIKFKISESIKDAPKIHNPIQENKNIFETTLPMSGDVIKMKTITGHDMKQFEKKSESLKRVGQELTTMNMLSVLILDTSAIKDEEVSEGRLLKYVSDLIMGDINALKKFLREIRRTPEDTITYKCPKCERKQEIPISFGFDFFFPEY